MHDHARKLKNHPEVSAVELLYHVANYWKHSDEWTDWYPVDNRKRTILALQLVGIGEDTEFPCGMAMVQIAPSLENLFDDLPDMLGSWRKSVVEYLLAEGFFERDGESAQPPP